MQTTLGLFQKNQTSATCSRHPERAALQLCDHCTRFFCEDCLGEAIKRPWRTYYYCFDEACNAAYNKMTKRELWPIPVLLLVALVAALRREWDALFWLGLSLISVGQNVKLLLAYRRREAKRKQIQADATTL